ncbi:MAG TPA: N-acetylmuramoyl-L-alanine amidase, partial [Thermoanaerobaculia bacterium]
MRKGWVAALGGILLSGLALAGETRQASLGPNVTARLDPASEINLFYQPGNGETWSRLALRMTGDAAHWKELARINGQGENLLRGRRVRVPLAMAKESLQLAALKALFPDDQQSAKGWKHKVVAGTAVEGESLWAIAEWFTGDGANYARIREANKGQTLSTRRGDVILIPNALLMTGLRSTAKEPEIAEDDPETQGNEPTVKVAAEIAATSDSDIQLEYKRAGDRPYAVYRLQQGEALYSSVGIRFTGRLYAKDVNDVVDQIVEFNGIRDVARIPVNYPVKIPMELLTAEWRPSDDPKRLAKERTERESARIANERRAAAGGPYTSRVKGSTSLSGVHVIIDAGHGGRDVGTDHDGVWEATYVYDVACRVKKTIESKTEAKVSMLTRSKSGGCDVADRNVLARLRDHEVLTTPRYNLEDPVIGVNLRWYLANSLYRRAIASAVPKEKVIFISIHADSLHPSLRGAMAYIPGEQYVRGSYTKNGKIYLARAEVRESPTVTQSEEEALMAEGLSAGLASSIVEAFRDEGLKVHPYDPVRDNVVRNGREWVPAVIRYNKVPTRLLLEVCNLGNPEDR